MVGERLFYTFLTEDCELLLHSICAKFSQKKPS